MHEHDDDGGAAHEVELRNATCKRKCQLELNTGNAAPPNLDAKRDGSSFEDKNRLYSQQIVEEQASVPLSRPYHGRFLSKHHALARSSSAQPVYTENLVEADHKHDTDAYIKAESEQASDNESIHHGGESDALGSTIRVTPSVDSMLPNAESQTANNEIPPLVDAPQEVQTILDRWWDMKGRKLPPCATLTVYKVLLQNLSGYGRKATWLHVSGEVLKPSMYRLFGRVHGTDSRIIVVKGPTVGPCIVGFLCNGGSVKGLTCWDEIQDLARYRCRMCGWI